MKTGIIGARGAGKSTVFHALTGLAPVPGTAEGKNRARPGQIKVADPRLDFLESAYGSKKKIPVELTIIDFAPNPQEQKEGAGLGDCSNSARGRLKHSRASGFCRKNPR